MRHVPRGRAAERHSPGADGRAIASGIDARTPAPLWEDGARSANCLPLVLSSGGSTVGDNNEEGAAALSSRSSAGSARVRAFSGVVVVVVVASSSILVSACISAWNAAQRHHECRVYAGGLCTAGRIGLGLAFRAFFAASSEMPIRRRRLLGSAFVTPFASRARKCAKARPPWGDRAGLSVRSLCGPES
ncbi:hypothetical protein HPB47_006034 [Ixodes persulcatus]|uniref:Uncharacterized protein n=1 Tax=Ixodes persulcatus TaxID=34615 RepID=A0AC60PBI1_IXOPE|nr:hypothetical protein HPB47_006034 [Ixodes persulcatus]